MKRVVVVDGIKAGQNNFSFINFRLEYTYSGATRLRVDNVQLGESANLSPMKITRVIHEEDEDLKFVKVFWNSFG